MAKQQRTYISLILALVGTVIFILFLLFIPDMSSTLISTIPETPPEVSILNSNEKLVTSALTIDKTNVKDIVAALSRPTEYFSETQSILSYEKGSATYTRQRYTKGGVSKVTLISTNRTQTMHYLYTEKKVYVWQEGNRNYHTAARGEFEPDDAQMMMTYEDIINAEDSNITTASLTTYENTPCIYAELSSPHTGYKERYWVSAANGLLLHGQTLDSSGAVIYSITATNTVIGEQPEDVFLLPNKKIPE